MKICLINIIWMLSIDLAYPGIDSDSLKTGADSLKDNNNFRSDSINTGNESNVNSAQEQIYIRNIIIAGNDITDEDIVTREISTKENSKLDPAVLKEDIERIYRLGLFNKVDVFPVPTDSIYQVDLMFLVEERFYILPLPQGGFKNGEFSKFWGGANVSWHNFRGRNETAAFSFGIGYEPFASMSYSVPWIGEKAHYYSSASIGYSKNYNQSLLALDDTTSNSIPSSADNFAIFNFNTSLTLGKFYTKNFSLASRLSYNLIESSPYEAGRTVSADGKDNFMTFSFSGRFDTRNSVEYSLSGSYYFLEYQKFGFGKLFDFNRVSFETKKFIPIKLSDNYFVCFATRSIGVISFGGTIPYYLDEYYGYDKIIRGYKKVVSEGENQLGLFNEFRIPVIDPFYFKGKSVPVIESISMLKNLNYKFGLYATLFFDIGGVWYKKDNFFNTRFINGFGAGLNFILPFGFVGRTDFAFRVEQKRFVPQIIFDLDASF